MSLLGALSILPTTVFPRLYEYPIDTPTGPEAVWPGGNLMTQILRRLVHEEQGQDIAEYAVMLAVILVIVVGTIRLIGSNANTVFSQVGSSIQ